MNNKISKKLFITLLDEVYQSGEKFKGINAQDEWYLDIIYAAGKISSSELARLTGVTKSAITPVTKKLVADGYLIKTQCEIDRRTYFLEVSDDIKKQYKKIYKNSPCLLDCEKLSEDEQKELSRLIKKTL